MQHVKHYWLSTLLCGLGLAFLTLFKFTGAYVDESGMLVEPFAFIPLFWLCQVSAMISFTITYLKRRKGLER